MEMGGLRQLCDNVRAVNCASPPRVLFVMALPPPYHGANVANEAIWNSALRERYARELVDLTDPRDLDNLGRLDVTNVWLALRATASLYSRLWRFEPDVVYLLVSQNVLAYIRDAFFIWSTKRFSNARVIVHLHGGYFRTFYETSGRWTRWFIDSTLPLADAGIVHTERLTHHLRPWLRNVYTVPNGADPGAPPEWTSLLETRIASNFVTITYLSNLIPSKGLLTLIGAIGRLSGLSRRLRVCIAGIWGPDPDGSTSAVEFEMRVKKAIHETDAPHRIELLGGVYAEAKKQLFRETDIFVLPTELSEGQPMSIIEAMAFGCVVISTDRGAIADTVIDGRTGFIVPERDPGALAARIEQLMDDTLRTTMARAARKRYDDEYRVEHFVERIGTVIERVTLAHNGGDEFRSP